MNEGRTERGRTLPVSSVALRIGFHYPFSFLLKNSFFFFLGAASLFPWDGLLSKITLRRSAILPILLAVKCSSAACVSPAGEIAVSQGISGHSLAKLSLTKGTHGQAIFLFFFLSKQGPVFVDGLQAHTHKKSPICFTVTWSAGLCPLFHFCFTCAFP